MCDFREGLTPRLVGFRVRDSAAVNELFTAASQEQTDLLLAELYPVQIKIEQKIMVVMSPRKKFVNVLTLRVIARSTRPRESTEDSQLVHSGLNVSPLWTHVSPP